MPGHMERSDATLDSLNVCPEHWKVEEDLGKMYMSTMIADLQFLTMLHVAVLLVDLLTLTFEILIINLA